MTEKREHWSSRLGFVLAAAGSAIGLGTMWKLPYVMGQNGGGAFILLFIIFNIVIGIPLFIVELLLGRQSQRGAVGSFAAFTHENSSWKIIGWMHIAGSLLVLGWYCVIGGWGLNYILMSLSDSFYGRTPEELGKMFEIFRASGDLNVFWQLVFIGITASIVVKGLSAGIEYWSRIMTMSLFAVLVILSIYSFTLDGFAEALHYLIYPNFSELTATGVLEALSMALFTLSLGYGIMVTYGSYMKKTEDIPKTALIVGIANLLVSLLIALMIFPIIFTFGFAPQEGEGLIFKALPYAFGRLPGAIVISTLFFALLVFAALTSSVSLLEVSVANLIDLKKWPRPKAVIVTTLIGFLIGLPTALAGTDAIFPSWPDIYGDQFLKTNNMVIDWLLAWSAFFTSIFVGFVVPRVITKEGFSSNSSFSKLFGVWLFLIRWLVPAAIFVIILQRARIIDIPGFDVLSDFLS